jgi:uncharacterized protein YndB with AHSA1/START domain
MDQRTLEPEAARTASISRTMAVPLKYVYAAHTRAEHIMRWFGPVGYPVTKCDYDFRVGGKWRMVMTGPDGKEGPPFGGEFLEIVPEKRIVYTDGFEDGKGGDMNLTHAGGRIVFTTTFAEDQGHTTVTVSVLFSTVAMKDEFLGVGMIDGIASGLDQWEDVARGLAG